MQNRFRLPNGTKAFTAKSLMRVYASRNGQKPWGSSQAAARDGVGTLFDNVNTASKADRTWDGRKKAPSDRTRALPYVYPTFTERRICFALTAGQRSSASET